MDSVTARGIRPRLPSIDLVVDVGFALLLAVCSARYFTRHPFDGVGIVVLVLALATGVSYAVAVTGRRDQPAGRPALRTRQGIGTLAATTFWLPLAVLAPSFGWCGFALFFAVHRVARGRLALIASAAIVVAVSAGLLVMSRGDDLGLVLGPFFGGLILASAYASLDRAVDEQNTLIGELIETRAQLARSERAAGALAERERVAGELHDTVVQRTATALLMLESDALSPGGQDSDALREARKALRAGLVETRQVLHGLADVGTGAESLAAAVRAYAEDAGATFTVSGRERPVPTPVGHALRRVVQEALTNARKHAQARAIHVTLTFFDGEVGVDIADDGIGFAHAAEDVDRREGTAHSGGFGVRAMLWRVESLGGTMTIESSAGEGTVVAAIVPVERPE